MTKKRKFSEGDISWNDIQRVLVFAKKRKDGQGHEISETEVTDVWRDTLKSQPTNERKIIEEAIKIFRHTMPESMMIGPITIMEILAKAGIIREFLEKRETQTIDLEQ